MKRFKSPNGERGATVTPFREDYVVSFCSLDKYGALRFSTASPSTPREGMRLDAATTAARGWVA